TLLGMAREASTGARVPLEALILAFQHSRAKQLVGTDALRTVLSASYRDMVTADRCDLTQVWTLLEGQPGFDPSAVKPALARFKSWEPRLGLEVVLPPAMAKLGEAELSELAAQVSVPTKEMARIFRGGHVTASMPVEGGGETSSKKVR